MKKYKFSINDIEYAVEVKNIEDKTLEVHVNGASYIVELDKEVKETKTPTLVRSVAVPSTDQGAAVKVDAKTGTIKSPLPGTIVDIFVKKGDTVTIGQKVLLLEAMKMENNIESDKEGTVAAIKVAKGDTVTIGQKVLLLEAMKMENEIASDKAGVVTEIKVAESDTVMEGDVLLVIGE